MKKPRFFVQMGKLFLLTTKHFLKTFTADIGYLISEKRESIQPCICIFFFCIQGQFYNEMGSFQRDEPKFAQFDIVEKDQAIKRRQEPFTNLNKVYLQEI
jgi:hypothetical protein